VQCKNTARVSLEDVAKEIGLATSLKSNFIVIVTTGEIGPEARRYGDKVMADGNLCVIMVDGDDLRAINENASKIVDVFNREAFHAMKLKALAL
jgi:site-specific DNA-methyltransferase (cytosine-N4-specific)